MFGLKKRKIGLALSSGGAKGITHVGVLKELERNNIHIDYIAGCSAGALAGALYAVTQSTKAIEDILYSIDYKKFNEYFYDFSFKSGLVKGDKLFNFLDNYIDDNMLIQDTKIPLNIVATDLNSGKRFVFKEGNLKQAIRASMSMPFIFEPIKLNDMVLVDGGLTEVIPAKTVREMGATKVIGVNLNYGGFARDLSKQNLTLLKVANESMEVVFRELAYRDSLLADVCIDMPIESIPLSTFADDPTNLIDIGIKETRKRIPEIKLL